MQKMILPILFLGALAISSCKCHTCTCTPLGITTTHKVCRDSYNSKADYDNDVKTFENAGCKCKLSN